MVSSIAGASPQALVLQCSRDDFPNDPVPFRLIAAPIASVVSCIHESGTAGGQVVERHPIALLRRGVPRPLPPQHVLGASRDLFDEGARS